MDRPILRPTAAPPGEGAPVAPAPASREPRRRIRTGWKAGIVRVGSFRRLQEIQKSTTDPVIDLSYLLDACVQLALELGPEAIVQRAVQALRPLQRVRPLPLNPPPGETS